MNFFKIIMAAYIVVVIFLLYTLFFLAPDPTNIMLEKYQKSTKLRGANQ